MRTFSNHKQAFVATVAALFAVSSQFCRVPSVDAQAISVYCGGVLEAYTDCKSCLLAGCGWGEDRCYSECAFVLQDTCHDLYDPTDTRNATQICAESVNHATDAVICESITDCETCTNTTKSDNVTTCEWFEVSSVVPGHDAYCGTGGNNVGLYGQTTCDNVEPSKRDLIFVDDYDIEDEEDDKNLRG